MKWLNLLMQIMSGSVSNFVRGRGILPQGDTFSRILMAIYWTVPSAIQALICGYSNVDTVAVSAIIFVGTLAWAIPGWGLYFSSFDGVWGKGESEQKWIDWICLRLVPYVSEADTAGNLKRGFIGMTLRGLYIAPLFVALALYLNNWHLVLFGIGGVAQGAIYSSMRFLKDKSQGPFYAEPATGAFFNLLIGTAIIVHLIWPGVMVNGN